MHDIRWDSQFAALLNLLRTAFICAAICAGTILFNRDAAQLVLQPIDRMLKQVLRAALAEGHAQLRSVSQGMHADAGLSRGSWHVCAPALIQPLAIVKGHPHIIDIIAWLAALSSIRCLCWLSGCWLMCAVSDCLPPYDS